MVSHAVTLHALLVIISYTCLVLLLHPAFCQKTTKPYYQTTELIEQHDDCSGKSGWLYIECAQQCYHAARICTLSYREVALKTLNCILKVLTQRNTRRNAVRFLRQTTGGARTISWIVEQKKGCSPDSVDQSHSVVFSMPTQELIFSNGSRSENLTQLRHSKTKTKSLSLFRPLKPNLCWTATTVALVPWAR